MAAPVGRRSASPSTSPSRSEDPNPEDDETSEKKVFEKEKAVLANPEEKKEETETQINTRLNGLLYHTSNDSIDLYRLENNSLDLLGRLYYDDYDSEFSVLSPSPINPSVERVASYTSLSKMNSGLNLVSMSSNLELARQQKTPSASNLPDMARSLVLRPPSRPNMHRLGSFERGVSFDTLLDDHHLAITLKVKHPQFKFRRNNKTFLIGFSNDAESLRAVEWVFQEMAINGDTVIVLQVLDDKYYRQVDPALAEQVLAKLEKLNTHSKKISLVYEVVIGKPQKLLKLAIEEYKPNTMIVGTHQQGGVLQLSPSSTNIINLSHHTHHHHHHHHHMPFLSKASVSKYFMQFALVPVIVVKPYYHYHENLDQPIDSEEYFQNLLASIDVSHTREKKKSRLGMRSPLLSAGNSSTNLADMKSEAKAERGRDTSFSIGSREHSPSESSSRSSSKTRHRWSKIFGH